MAAGVPSERRVAISLGMGARFPRAARFRVLEAFAEVIPHSPILDSDGARPSQATDLVETRLARLAADLPTSEDLDADSGLVMATVGAASGGAGGWVSAGDGLDLIGDLGGVIRVTRAIPTGILIGVIRIGAGDLATSEFTPTDQLAGNSWIAASVLIAHAAIGRS